MRVVGDTRRLNGLGVLNLLLTPSSESLGCFMGIGVVADLVTGITHLTGNLRILLRRSSHHEEGGLDLMFI